VRRKRNRDYTYIKVEDVPKWRKLARDYAFEDLWFFAHSLLYEIVTDQGGRNTEPGYDGFFKIKEFDINGAATRLQIAFEERAKFRAKWEAEKHK